MSAPRRICGVEDLAVGEVRQVEMDGQPIALVRVNDGYRAIGDTCSHADVSLSEGEVWTDDCMLECWKHGSRFSLLTGEPDTLPATQPVPVYRVEVDGDDVMIQFPEEGGR